MVAYVPCWSGVLKKEKKKKKETGMNSILLLNHRRIKAAPVHLWVMMMSEDEVLIVF